MHALTQRQYEQHNNAFPNRSIYLLPQNLSLFGNLEVCHDFLIFIDFIVFLFKALACNDSCKQNREKITDTIKRKKKC